jgi:aspartate/methionine/tyrosine aminotransferase
VRLSQRTLEQVDSPIGAAYSLLTQRVGTAPLIDLAQAAPQYPPAPEVIEHILRVAGDPVGAAYVETPGLPKLRESFAAELSRDYRAEIDPSHIVITAGCNQAFCLVASALAEPGDEVILALPYYFNHDMWLRMQGFVPVYLEPGPDLVPTPDALEELVTPRTRAVVLISPGNPTGVTVSPAGLAAFADTARRHGIALIIDETYRSFRSETEPAHGLLADPDWTDTVVSLHSFSKELAIPGYRVGAVVAGPPLLREVTKLLDCAAICAPRIGQEAAWAGLARAGRWRQDRVGELAARRVRFGSAMAERPGGFELLSCGAYFAWIRHPFPDRPTEELVRDLVIRHDILVLPGTAFLPDDRRTLRVSFANGDDATLAEFTRRIASGVS